MAMGDGLQVGELRIALLVNDVPAAAEFYRSVLGAEIVERHFTHYPGGPVSPLPHGVELQLGATRLSVQRENPRWRDAPRPDWPRSPLSAGAASVALTLHVTDVDAVFARAVAAGASPQQPGGAPEDTWWGDRVVQIHDPFGHFWRIQTRVEDIPVAARQARFEALQAAHRAARERTATAAE